VEPGAAAGHGLGDVGVFRTSCYGSRASESAWDQGVREEGACPASAGIVIATGIATGDIGLERGEGQLKSPSTATVFPNWVGSYLIAHPPAAMPAGGLAHTARPQVIKAMPAEYLPPPPRIGFSCGGNPSLVRAPLTVPSGTRLFQHLDERRGVGLEISNGSHGAGDMIHARGHHPVPAASEAQVLKKGRLAGRSFFSSIFTFNRLVPPALPLGNTATAAVPGAEL
jgi:hypothetical protein